jgi:Domain of unknown function (DUF4345)
MARAFFQCSLCALGLVVIAIALGLFLLGPQSVANFCNALLQAIWPITFKSFSNSWTRDSDSELRFYAVFWLAYGICLIAVARDVNAKSKLVSWLLALFFMGGIGRAVSILQVGFPHPLFLVLMAIELMLPPILYAVFRLSVFVYRRR